MKMITDMKCAFVIVVESMTPRSFFYYPLVVLVLLLSSIECGLSNVSNANLKNKGEFSCSNRIVFLKVMMKDHYEVLNVPWTADAETIKKAHRKLALQWHPDKNLGKTQEEEREASEMFRLVQQAYECLSDPTERKWYDEHREAILRGWSVDLGVGNDKSSSSVQILFDVVPFMHPSCFNGFGDDEKGFFAVYSKVFSQIYDQEQEGWLFEGNIDSMPTANLLPKDYGNGNTPWSEVSYFYKAWESFTSCRTFAWADKYNTKDADDRRMRRAMEDENRKSRRNAKRQFQDDILALVKFCKRRDPRVAAYNTQLEQQKLQKKQDEALAIQRQKEQTRHERSLWKENAEHFMAKLEEEDRAAGRVRLADLDDEEQFDYGGGKGKKSKRNKKKKNALFYEFKEEELEFHDSDGEVDISPEAAVLVINKIDNPNDDSLQFKQTANDVTALKESDVSSMQHQPEESSPKPHLTNMPSKDDDMKNKNEEDEEKKEEENETIEKKVCPPVSSSHSHDGDGDDSESGSDVWYCDVCRKEFKSSGQLENHMKSKKHKETMKKKCKSQNSKPDNKAILDDLMDDLKIRA
jgi:DnaJ homolog subfamily A member 5